MDKLIARLKSELPPGTVMDGNEAVERAQGWGKIGVPRALFRPSSTAEVSQILGACHAAGVGVVPWGGRTGLVEGTYAEGLLALSLERMNKIEEIDAAGATMTVQAGCILQNVCEAADEAGLLFPLDLGARGSATIGGNISTNAGGNRVIRFGMTRDLVLGIEAVLADGTVMTSLNHLIKNNAGYDLKHLFIGSEGTLGIVTRAVLRLRPKPVSQNMTMMAVAEFASLPKLLRRLEKALGGTLSAFEVMWEDFYTLVTTPPAQGIPPVPHGYPYYVMVEAMGGDQEADDARFERVLGEALEGGDIVDAVIAKSQAERNKMWGLRDDVAQVIRMGPFFTFDVSLRIPEMESFVAEVRAGLNARWPQFQMMIFGHLGDGNLHVIPGVGEGTPEARRAVEEIVYGALRTRGGSVSAEHGIGLEKRRYLPWSRSEEEIALMKTLKRALDPKNILNPGKVFEAE